MEWTYQEDGGVRISKLDPFLAELVQQIPAAADADASSAAQQRLFYSPVADEDDPSEEIQEDWQEYVEPGLRSLFVSADDVVRGDLVGMQMTKHEGAAMFSLEITKANLHAWISTLNRARLVLAETHAFTESEIAAELRMNFETRRDLALFQINLYGLLLDFLLDGVESL